MRAAKREHPNTRLLQLRQARCYKTAVLLVGARCVEEITGLQKQVNSLADSEIRRLLKSMTLALAQFLALAWMLTRNCIAQVIIGSQYYRNDIIRFFLHVLFACTYDVGAF
jgi:hypothetical protein